MNKNCFFKYALLGITSIASVSCSQSFYQVYTMALDNLKMQDNSMVYENEDCQVSYNLWSEGGFVAFSFKNKTDKDIFINMNESFLVVNGNAHNYFEDKTYTCGSVLATAYGYGESLGVSLTGKDAIWSDRLYTASARIAGSVSSKAAVLSTVSIKEQKIVCVPANSYKTFRKFCLQPDIFQKCDKKYDYPSGKASLVSYSKANSPILMNNRLTYGFRNDNMDKHLDNIFWLSEINNYSEKAAIEDRKEKGCYDLDSRNVKYFKIGTPSQFYRFFQLRK